MARKVGIQPRSHAPCQARLIAFINDIMMRAQPPQAMNLFCIAGDVKNSNGTVVKRHCEHGQESGTKNIFNLITNSSCQKTYETVNLKSQ